MNRIAKVEDDYHEMMELKKRAEAADVAKSQVLDGPSYSLEHFPASPNMHKCPNWFPPSVVPCYCVPRDQNPNEWSSG